MRDQRNTGTSLNQHAHEQAQRSKVWRVFRPVLKVHPAFQCLCRIIFPYPVHRTLKMRNDLWKEPSRIVIVSVACVKLYLHIRVEGSVGVSQEMVENSLSRTSWLSVFRETFFLTFRLMERTWRHAHLLQGFMFVWNISLHSQQPLFISYASVISCWGFNTLTTATN